MKYPVEVYFPPLEGYEPFDADGWSLGSRQPDSGAAMRHAYNALEFQAHAGLIIQLMLGSTQAPERRKLVYPCLGGRAFDGTRDVKVGLDSGHITPIGVELITELGKKSTLHVRQISLGYMPAPEHNQVLAHLRSQTPFQRSDADDRLMRLVDSLIEYTWKKQGVEFDHAGIPRGGYVKTLNEAHDYLRGQTSAIEANRFGHLPAGALYKSLAGLPRQYGLSDLLQNPTFSQGTIKNISKSTAQAYHAWRYEVNVVPAPAEGDWRAPHPLKVDEQGYRQVGFIMRLREGTRFAFTRLHDLSNIDATTCRWVIRGQDRADTLESRVRKWMDSGGNSQDQLCFMLWDKGLMGITQTTHASPESVAHTSHLLHAGRR